MNDEPELPDEEPELPDDELLRFASEIEGFQRKSDDRIDDRVVGRIVARALEDFHFETDQFRGGSAGTPKIEIGHDVPTSPADEPSRSSTDAQHPVVRIAGQNQRTLGDYQLLRQLGAGGMGVVWEARHRSLGERRFALKVLRQDRQLRRSALERFVIEARVLARFDHEHIVPVYHIGQDAGIHYFVMKLIEGNNLAELIGDLKLAVSEEDASQDDSANEAGSTYPSYRSKGDTVVSREILGKITDKRTASVPEFIDAVVRLGIQVADALDHAHQMGVVHRDIKPANILVDRNGNAWIADFGLAHVMDSTENMTRTGGLVGTGPYMSPEQCLGTKRSILDQRTDIYSLGITLYELLTLRRAFPSVLSDPELLHRIQFEDPIPARKIDPRIPRDLETIVLRAIRKRPSERYESAAAMAADLRRFANDEALPIGVRPTVWEKTKQWARTHRQTVAALSATFATSIVAAALFGVFAYNAQANALAAESRQKEEAVAEKTRVERLLQRSEGLRLAANSALSVEADPTLATLLGIKATELHPSIDAHRALQRAIGENHELRTLSGHREAVGSIAFNDDGSRLVSTTTRDNFASDTPSGAYLWDVATGELIQELRDADTVSSITSAVYSPDKVRILTTSVPSDANAASGDEERKEFRPPRLWEDATFGSLVTFKEAYLLQATGDVFDSQGRQIVLPAKDNTARIYDCIRGTELRTLEGHEKRVVKTAYGPAGKLVASASDDNTLRIWNADNGEQIHAFDFWKTEQPLAETCLIDSFEFRADGRQLLTVSEELGIHLWDLVSGERVETPTISENAAFYWPDGMRFSTFDPTKGTRIETHDSFRGAYLNRRSIGGYLQFVEISPDSKTLAVKTSNTGRLSFWDLSRPGNSVTEIAGHKFAVNSIRFSPNSQILATASDDKTIKLWSLSNGRTRNTFSKGANLKHSKTAVSPDDQKIAIPSLGSREVSSVFRFGDGQIPADIRGRIWMPEYSEFRFVVSDTNQLKVYDIETADLIGSIPMGPGDVHKVVISRQGSHVAAYAGGEIVTLWSVDDDRQIPLVVGERAVIDLEFTDDGKRLLSASDDGVVRIWDVESTEQLKSFSLNEPIKDLELSRDGNRLVIVNDQNQADTWNLTTLERESRLESAEAVFTKAKLNSDGTRLLTYNKFNASSVQAWNVETANLIGQFAVEGNCHVAVHPRDNEAIICSQQGAEIWRFETDERIPLIDQPRAFGSYAPDESAVYTCSNIPIVDAIESGEDLDPIPAKFERWTADEYELDQRFETFAGSPTEFFIGTNRRVLMSFNRSFGITVHQIKSGERLSHLPGHLAAVSDVLFTPDGSTLISAGRDARIHFWDLAEGTLSETLLSHQRPIGRAVISGDGKRLLSVDIDGEAVLSAVPTGQELKRFSFDDKYITQLALSSDGNRALAVFPSGKFAVQDLEENEPVGMPGDLGSVAWAEFSKQSDEILIIPTDSRVVDEDETETDTNYPVLVISNDGSESRSYAFTQPVVTSHFLPTGTEIVTLTRDGQVAFTNRESGELADSVQSQSSRVLAAITDSSGKWLAIHEGATMLIWNLSEKGKEWMRIGSGGVGARRVTPQSPYQFPKELDRFNPFTPGSIDWLIIEQSSSASKVPFSAAVQNEFAPRSLSEGERSRFLIPAVAE
ncbi:MAG: protein kinase [Planctomycetota bacterium]